ncbi:MAG: folylpolyglutamate synthase/dihydrofolate synthase family protein [Desulfobacterales bacterium]|nr:folylpolyglutamate synthase/dihydrofolate synthase family protein [Desulfobacterales bacterium]
MNYKETWTFLDNLQFFKIKLGLESMRMFLQELGSPEEDLKFVHIAGTNGKGSVAVTLLTLLAEAGYSVGLYTSPHLSSVRERFRINDEFISEEEFAEEGSRIHAILGDRQITYFEFTTALAILWFARRKVDLVILEVGMGGRLDATNVITPLVSVITNVSMDHELYLGNTLAEIAGEKAGIIKKGVPVVSGVGIGETEEERTVLSVVERFCQERSAPLFLHGRDFFVEPVEDNGWNYWAMKRKGCCQLREKITGLTTKLKGKYQMINTGLALATLEFLNQFGFSVDDSQIRSGLLEVSWPGRLESFCLSKADGSLVDCSAEDSLHYLLDGAHNLAGVVSLQEALENDFQYERLILVWASMSDKDFRAGLPQISRQAQVIILTRLEYERSAQPEELLEAMPENIQDRVICENSLDAALAKAAELAGRNDLICIAGSLYLIGEARARLLGKII